MQETEYSEIGNIPFKAKTPLNVSGERGRFLTKGE